jgi:hypothetical protein
MFHLSKGGFIKIFDFNIFLNKVKIAKLIEDFISRINLIVQFFSDFFFKENFLI